MEGRTNKSEETGEQRHRYHHHHSEGSSHHHSGEHHHHHHHSNPTSEFRKHMKKRARNKKIIERVLLSLASILAGIVIAALLFAYFIDN